MSGADYDPESIAARKALSESTGLEHVAQEPTAENGGASWWCATCEQDCASDNPCDHCQDGADEWYAAQRMVGE